MTLIRADRVCETTTTTGTGAVSLAGAINGYQGFGAVMANGDTCYYGIEAIDGSGVPTGAWETGLGTYASGGNTLTRTSVSDSSNAGAAVNFGAGTKRVILSLISTDVIDNLVGGGSGAPWWFSPPLASQLTAISHDADLPIMADDADVGLFINFRGAAAGDKTRAVYKTITTPASNWTFEGRMNWGVPRINFIYGGLFLQEAATGQLITLGFIEDGGMLNVSRCASLSAGGSQVATLAVQDYQNFFRITFDNGTGTLTYQWSLDGKNWITLGSENYTSSFTGKPDRVGFGMTTNLASSGTISYLTIDRAVFPA